MSTQIEKKPSLLMTVGRGIEIRSIDEAYRFAVAVVKGGLAPKGDTPETVVVKLQAGAELGLPPMQALANLVVVNNRVSIMGTGATALIRRHPDCEKFMMGNDGEGDDRCGFVVSQRKGEPSYRIEFSVKDAKRAGLWGKGQWQNYPDDMLIWRAVSRAGKRYWSDALLGLPLTEEARDYREVSVDYTVEKAAPVAASGPDPLLLEEAEPDDEMPASTRCPHCGFPYADPDQDKCGNCGETKDPGPVVSPTEASP